MPEPDNPWPTSATGATTSFIYLQKLFEVSAQFHPGMLAELLIAHLQPRRRAPSHPARTQILENSFDTTLVEKLRVNTGQAHEPGGGERHLDEHPVPGMECRAFNALGWRKGCSCR